MGSKEGNGPCLENLINGHRGCNGFDIDVISSIILGLNFSKLLYVTVFKIIAAIYPIIQEGAVISMLSAQISALFIHQQKN